MSRPTSTVLYKKACQFIPGGVNSPVRSFRGVGGTPIFFKSAQGPYLTDVDGNCYIDYVGSWGPMIQGHNFEPVIHAIRNQTDQTVGFGAPSGLEIEMAELLAGRMPSIEKVRMVNSGTEATMSAIRLARGFTGRDKIVKFEGCYHGHGDSLLVKAGSGILTFGLADSAGVPESLAQHTLTIPYNDLETATQVFEAWGNEIAAIIVEPIAGNMGCIPPDPGFLNGLRMLTESSGSLLIFDEVMTGFRVAFGGAQDLYGVTPDLTTLGKVIGAGLPVGAFGGRAEILDQLAPDGPVYQAGTLSGNPIAMRAGIALLRSLDTAFYKNLEIRTKSLVDTLISAAAKKHINMCANQVCGMFSLFFTDQVSIRNYQHVQACDADRYSIFFHRMLDGGVYLAPSAFESAFVSGAHTEKIIEVTTHLAEAVFSSFT